MKTNSIKPLLIAMSISLPVFLSGCETMNSMWDDSGHRYYSPDHRPVDIYENDRQAVRHENHSAGRSYSITNQQGRTHQTSAQEEDNDTAVPVTPPSVPGVAPQLAD